MHKWLTRIIFIFLFLISRWYVLVHPPYADSTPLKPGYGYSDVKHDSERYANMWYYGLTPYRQHLFEYPPMAIPVMYVPLLVDQAHIGHYYQNYRFEIFMFELLLFVCLLKTLEIIWLKQPHRLWLALGFYCLIGVIGKDFWYDGLDLIFIGFFMLSLCLKYLTGLKVWWQKILFWALFSVSFGIKYMTLPLALPLFWFKRKEWKKEVAAGIIGFLLVWGLPLALYRSSLSVMLYFHTSRPFNYGSLGTWLTWAINDFTHSEVQTKLLPHLPIEGPVSHSLQALFEKLFPLAILISIGGATYSVHKKFISNRDEELRLTLIITLVYFMAIFLTNKVFSNPFHIWYIPLIVLLPLGSLRETLGLMFGSMWMFILDTTAWIRVPLPFVRFRDFTRFIPLFGFLGWSIKKLHSDNRLKSSL